MVELAIINFQAIKKSKIKIDGITCLVATNNVGKTTHVRGIKALVTNISRKDNIRSGQSGFAIGFKDSKERKIVYKREKTVLYSIFGEAFKKVGREPLVDIRDDTGFIYEREGETKILPQFVFQKVTPFPFNLTASKKYTQFSKFFGVSKIETVLKDINADLKTEKSELSKTNIKLDLASLNIDHQRKIIEKFPTEEEVENLIKSIRDTSNRLEQLKLMLEKTVLLKSVEGEKEKTEKRVEKLKAGLVKFNPIDEERRVCESDIVTAKSFLSNFNSVSNEIRRGSETLAKVKVIPFDKIKSFISDFMEVGTLKERLETLCDSIGYIENEIVLCLKKVEEQRIKLNKFDRCGVCDAPIKDGVYSE